MTPLERAARALARRSCPPGGEAQFPYVSADEWEEKSWRDHLPDARSVLTEIREPTPEMSEEAFKNGACGGHEDCWKAMIDAALSEN